MAAAVELRRKALAEGLGTALLLAIVVGSGVMASAHRTVALSNWNV